MCPAGIYLHRVFEQQTRGEQSWDGDFCTLDDGIASYQTHGGGISE